MREVLGELEDVLDAGAPPAVHRLIVVADAAQVACASRQQPQPRVLDGVGVLELVDEDMAEAFPVVREHVVAVAKQLVTPEQQLGEVHDPGALAGLLVRRIDAQHAGHPEVVAILDMLGAKPFVLARVDERLRLPCRPALFVEVEIAQHTTDAA